MFDITNSRDFYAKLLADFDDYMERVDSARHAMNCAIIAHHLHDWVWADYLKNDVETRQRMEIGKNIGEFVRWIDSQSVWFSMVQEISNGSKHFGRDASFVTKRVGAFQAHAFHADAFDVSRLIIDNGEGAGDQRILSVPMLLEVVVRFWRDFFRNYSPYKDDLPKGRTLLMGQ